MVRPFCLRVFAFPFGAFPGGKISPGPIIRSLIRLCIEKGTTMSFFYM